MNTEAILDAVEESVESQLALGAESEAVEAAAVALLAVLRPALQHAAFQIAEQAAVEVGAQLPGYAVNVVLEEGEPAILLREDPAIAGSVADDLSARITLRLPDALKSDIEAAAGEVGESINAYVIKTLHSKAKRPRSRRITETFET